MLLSLLKRSEANLEATGNSLELGIVFVPSLLVPLFLSSFWVIWEFLFFASPQTLLTFGLIDTKHQLGWGGLATFVSIIGFHLYGQQDRVWSAFQVTLLDLNFLFFGWISSTGSGTSVLTSHNAQHQGPRLIKLLKNIRAQINGELFEPQLNYHTTKVAYGPYFWAMHAKYFWQRFLCL